MNNNIVNCSNQNITLCVIPRENSFAYKRIKYLLTSYVSTSARNPSGNAIANETMAANSPSFA